MEPIAPELNRAEEPASAVVRQAAEWLAHLESGDATESDHRQFEAWRDADRAHAIAVERLGGIRDRLAESPAAERATLNEVLLRPQRRSSSLLLALLTLGALGWMAWRLQPVQIYFADQKTDIGHTQVVSLQDGSELTLSTDSAVDINMHGHARIVRLLRGEILARVSKGKAQHFTVETEEGTAVALGTAFTVRKLDGATTVSVSESHVEVCLRRDIAAPCTTLAPGESSRMGAKGIERLPNMLPSDVGAWASGWLTVNDRPVTEVLDELNRWRMVPIRFNRAELTGLNVSGTFPLADADHAANNLARLLRLRIDRSDPAAPVLRAQ